MRNHTSAEWFSRHEVLIKKKIGPWNNQGSISLFIIIQKDNNMSEQVSINQAECLGCEACVELCPEIFGFDIDETKAYVLMAEDGDEDCIEEAMASCPAGCITCE